MKQKELENATGNSLFDLYDSLHPQFLFSLDVFDEPTRKKILKKLKRETSRSNFLAVIAEATFGELFVNLGFEVVYDKKFPNNQIPDWLLEVSGSTVIAEVYRLGKSAKDQIRDDFEYQIIENLRLLDRDYVIRLKYLNEYFDIGLYDIDVIVREIDIWLSEPRSIGEGLLSQGNFQFEVVKNKTRLGGLFCNASGHVDIKLNKIVQTAQLDPNEITKKLNKYDSIISVYDYPYILCVSIDFGSGLGHEDFVEYFNGYDRQAGDFSNNPQLSAIITFSKGVFSLLVNPNTEQAIYKEKHRPILDRLLKLREDSK